MILFRFYQDIAENRHRGFGADDVKDLLQAVAKMVAVDFELHEGWAGWTETQSN